ncbi:TFIIH/NER complex subunit TFB4 [Sporobolomyces salmoneus]|uniref:TFIIH/NER complex subunit TFB4 n=1 Tax=Sporobolomyces salmoneus TaxID=183962 RepID=UPI003179E4B7
MATQVTGDLLCLILDLNTLAWSGSTHLTLDNALDQILVFANSHLALRHENQIALFAATNRTARQLYSSQLPPQPEAEDPFETEESRERKRTEERESNVYQSFRVVDENVVKGVKALVKELPAVDAETEESPRTGVNLVGALSMALCPIASSSSTSNGTKSSSENSNVRVQPRILILSVTPDEPSQYVPIMNCIFTAQKTGISIDCLKILGKSDSTFLQQATHLTSGVYYKLPSNGQTRSGLLQYLLVNFLSGPLASKHLNRAKQDQVDLRAACFCHRKIVDLGFVCSVCLSIFCSPLPVCTTCRTKFPMSTLKRLGFGARPKPTNGAGPPKKRKGAPAGGVSGRETASPAPPRATQVSVNGAAGGGGGATSP